MSELRYMYTDTPVGKLLLVANDEGLDAVFFERQGKPVRPDADWVEDRKPFKEVERQLKLYFAGKLTRFDVPLAPRGTPFQQKVWKQLRRIPFGKTLSYGELAERIGNPAASRAVGAANGKNPISIIVPCHRVIGADGSLTGFGGGLPVKRQLLEHEGVLEPELFR